MKLPNFLGAIATGLCVGLAAKALSFPTQTFLVIDLVAGTNLNSGSPGVWQRVIGNPIYIAVVTTIGVGAEIIGGYIAAAIEPLKFRHIVFMALAAIATHLVVNLDHPLWFHLLMIGRVLIASCIGAFCCAIRAKRAAHLKQQGVPPIARPY